MSEAAATRELRLLSAELDLQRDRFGRKESNKNTRALVLIGASILAAFLASDRASWVTDAEFRIDGGIIPTF